MSLQELVIWLPGSSNHSKSDEKLTLSVYSISFHIKLIFSYYLSSKVLLKIQAPATDSTNIKNILSFTNFIQSKNMMPRTVLQLRSSLVLRRWESFLFL